MAAADELGYPCAIKAQVQIGGRGKAGGIKLAHDEAEARMHAARIAAGAPLACARSGEWRHPVIGLWPQSLSEDLRRALVAEGRRKIEIWNARHGVAIAEWPATPIDPFFNVNTPEDAAQAQGMATEDAGASRPHPNKDA